MDISELLRSGAEYARCVAEYQGDSNHLWEAEQMEKAADTMEQKESFRSSDGHSSNTFERMVKEKALPEPPPSRLIKENNEEKKRKLDNRRGNK